MNDEQIKQLIDAKIKEVMAEFKRETLEALRKDVNEQWRKILAAKK